MQATDLETDLDEGASGARAGRALALIAVSLVAVVVSGAIYLGPALGGAAVSTQPVNPLLRSDYRVTSVNFISPTSGWLVVGFPSGDYGVIHTTDAGATWTRELTAPGDSHAVYAKFFDDLSGVVALVGGRPVVNRTVDGGLSWVSIPALTTTAIVMSWSFVDSLYGWMLARDRAAAAPKLYRTEDGG